MNTKQIEQIQATVTEIFAMPEREQSAAWEVVITFMDTVISDPAENTKRVIAERDIYISIAKEAKYFR